MKGNQKIILIVLITVSLLLPTWITVFAGKADYMGHWAENPINEFIQKGYVDASIKPDSPISRSEFISIANKAFGLKEKALINFSDIPSDSVLAEDVAKAIAAGYINGYEDGTMKPNNTLTRQEAAKAVSILKKCDATCKLCCIDNFKDSVDISQGYKDYMSAAVENGYFHGYPDGTIRPLRPISTAEAITILYNAECSDSGMKIEDGSTTDQQFVSLYKGFLIDEHCFKLKNPETDTKMCLQMQMCQSSGYGIAVKQPDGKYLFYKFDATGNTLAIELLKKTSKESSIIISVLGILDGNNLKVSSIFEDNISEKKEQVFEGLLSDSDCSPKLSDPAKMTTKCLLCTKCEASGYGISILQSDGTYKFYKFDIIGHMLAKINVVGRTKKDTVPNIVVKGILEDNIIKAYEIKEK